MKKSLVNTSSKRSDVDAKRACASVLEKRGYRDVKVTKSPADITARLGGKLHYFELKCTEQKTRYFGAASLTAWEAALRVEFYMSEAGEAPAEEWLETQADSRQQKFAALFAWMGDQGKIWNERKFKHLTGSDHDLPNSSG